MPSNVLRQSLLNCITAVVRSQPRCVSGGRPPVSVRGERVAASACLEWRCRAALSCCDPPCKLRWSTAPRALGHHSPWPLASTTGENSGLCLLWRLPVTSPPGGDETSVAGSYTRLAARTLMMCNALCRTQQGPMPAPTHTSPQQTPTAICCNQPWRTECRAVAPTPGHTLCTLPCPHPTMRDHACAVLSEHKEGHAAIQCRSMPTNC